MESSGLHLLRVELSPIFPSIGDVVDKAAVGPMLAEITPLELGHIGLL